MMMPTANPHADAERWEDQAEATAQSVEAADNAKHAEVLDEVREAILTGDARAIVQHVAINGRPVTVSVSEMMWDHMHDQDERVIQLLFAAVHGDTIGAACIAESIISTVAHRHADDVVERLDLCGEVML
jgi:hypothetical protein